MATYIIGDIQGCLDELLALLNKVQFNPDTDRLGFVGDLVNRGPQSIDVLRFIKQLKDPLIVLGNHDLYLLIIGYDLVDADKYQHTLHNVLDAPDKIEILDWLRQQPLILQLPQVSGILVHAGLPPQWNVAQCFEHANEVSSILNSLNFCDYLTDLFGNEPSTWHENLSGQDRLRYITNAFTRMRFCTQTGELEFATVDNKHPHNNDFLPWFDWRNQQHDATTDIYFGHWAALGGQCNVTHIHALDTGCAWGQRLTAIRVEDKQLFSVPSHNPSAHS